MQNLKMHIEECNNGWLLTINPTNGNDPLQAANLMFDKLKEMIPGQDDELKNIMQNVNKIPQNQKMVFATYKDLVGYLSLMVE